MVFLLRTTIIILLDPVNSKSRESTLSALQEDTLLDWTGRTSAWWDNFVNEVVVPEEWQENFRMPRKNLLKLKLPNFESK